MGSAFFSVTFVLWAICAAAPAAWAGQTESPHPAATALPDAPTPQEAVVQTQQPPRRTMIYTTSNGTPCETVHDGNPRMVTGDLAPDGSPLAPCPHHAIPKTSERFINGTEPDYLTTKEKAELAERDLVDPYDAATVVGDAGISMATNPKSRYGTGATGFGKSVGVGLAQDSSSEVTNTFLIPALTHQDPRYHREPHASKVHRTEHAIVQVVWTESDKGKGMPNYSNIVGNAADGELSNMYVPGVRTSPVATVERYGTGLALAPVDNLVTEFAPDIASHIHLKSAFWQDIVDRVAGVAGAGTPVAAVRHGGGGVQASHAGRRH